jgi:hypothetical protein
MDSWKLVNIAGAGTAGIAVRLLYSSREIVTHPRTLYPGCGSDISSNAGKSAWQGPSIDEARLRMHRYLLFIAISFRVSVISTCLLWSSTVASASDMPGVPSRATTRVEYGPSCLIEDWATLDTA